MSVDSELHTALSVFKKFPSAKQLKVIEGALEIHKKNTDERELGKSLSLNGFNPIEKQLALVIIRENLKHLQSLGDEKMEILSRLLLSLKSQTLTENVIAASLRYKKFSEEQIHFTLELAQTLSPGNVTKSAHGRGDDEFSQVLRTCFSQARDLYLLQDELAEKVLFEMALSPKKTGGLQLILREMTNLLPSIKKVRPFWWNETHDTILEEALIRRFQPMIGEPIVKLMNLFHEVPTYEELLKACEDLKLTKEFADFYLRARNHEQENKQTEIEQPILDLVQFPKSALGLFRETLRAWIFYYYEVKGSGGWSSQKLRIEFISEKLLEQFKEFPSDVFSTIPSYHQVQIEKAIALLHHIPNRLSENLDKRFVITEIGQTSLISRYSRFLNKIVQPIV